MISYSSSTASSAPATSANVVFGMSFDSCLAFDLPKPIIPPRPPPCMRFMTKKKMPSRMIIGSTNSRIDVSQLSCVTLVLYCSAPDPATLSNTCSEAALGYFAMISVLPSVASSPFLSHRRTCCSRSSICALSTFLASSWAIATEVSTDLKPRVSLPK